MTAALAQEARRPSETAPCGAATEPAIRIHGLSKSYGTLAVLKSVDLDVFPGEVVVIIGPSGAGKSTILSCVNCLEPFDAGESTARRAVRRASRVGAAAMSRPMSTGCAGRSASSSRPTTCFHT